MSVIFKNMDTFDEFELPNPMFDSHGSALEEEVPEKKTTTATIERIVEYPWPVQLHYQGDNLTTLLPEVVVLIASFLHFTSIQAVICSAKECNQDNNVLLWQLLVKRDLGGFFFSIFFFLFCHFLSEFFYFLSHFFFSVSFSFFHFCSDKSFSFFFVIFLFLFP